MTDENVVGARQMNAPAGNRVLMGHCIPNVGFPRAELP
jgi:hypothetical protein